MYLDLSQYTQISIKVDKKWIYICMIYALNFA